MPLPCVLDDDIDRLLERLRAVHGEPRRDIAPGLNLQGRLGYPQLKSPLPALPALLPAALDDRGARRVVQWSKTRPTFSVFQ